MGIGTGNNPNSHKALVQHQARFTTEYQPLVRNHQHRGKHMKTLMGEIFDKQIEIDDVIAGAKRKVTIAEAVLLKLCKAAIIKEEPWAIERLIKEGIHDGLDTVQVEHILSPAAAMILEKAGVAEAAKLIECEVIEHDSTTSNVVINQDSTTGGEVVNKSANQAAIIDGEIVVSDDSDLADLLA